MKRQNPIRCGTAIRIVCDIVLMVGFSKFMKSFPGVLSVWASG